MDKQEIYNYLKEKNISYEVTNHKAVYNMEEASEIDIPYPNQDAKNLFVRDDKKKNYYLITVKGNKRLDLKEFSLKNNTRRLSFASKEDLMKIMKLIPGAVTPFGILNDKDNIVKFYLDKEFLKEPKFLGVHPNDNTATIWIKTDDLINIIKDNGNEVKIF